MRTTAKITALIGFATLLVCLSISPVLALGDDTSVLSTGDTVDLVIEDARLVLGNGEVIEGGDLAIHEGRIVAVQKDTSGLDATRRIDAGGKTVLPGFIDTHVHLLLQAMAVSDEALQQWMDQELSGLFETYLAAGFTTIMSMGDPYPAILTVREQLANGKFKGPRLLVAGPMFTAPGGHPAGTLCGNNDWCKEHVAVQADDPEAARAKVRELVDAGVDAIKAVYDGAPMFPQMSDEVLAALADEARANGVALMVHSTSPGDMLRAMEQGVSHFAHTVWKDTLSDDDLALLEIAGLPVSTPSGWPIRKTSNEPRLANMRRLKEAGALIAFGTDIPRTAPTDALALEAGDLAAVLSTAEIVTALTKDAATFLGLGDELGQLATGYTADVVIVDGDPLADLNALKNVVVVIKGGEVIVERASVP